ncbi:hypothetical protein NFI96_011669 [Prochilodus magdalenae]|nr:hypothetical protein NFI96_011669 [Prochilodus magdalenae]
MATLGNNESRPEHTHKSEKLHVVSPLKIRQLLREGVASQESVLNRSTLISDSLASSFVNDTPSEATNKNAFFDRVESYSISFLCCQAFLCASIQPSLDFQKYEGRILELTKQLQTQHEKFCSWPDFPCPDRFWMVPFDEPKELLSAFVERFKSACLLQQQLPTLKPEQLKAMALTEDVISSLLQLIEEELKKQEGVSLDSLNIQMTACVVALCGWEASPGLGAVNLPVLNCAFCMRKVGLWNFHQLEGGFGDGENSSYSQFSTVFPEARTGDRLTPTSPSQSPTPCRMKLRSQDGTRTEQSESTSSLPRIRSRDSPSPSEEIGRGKRPLTRSRGQGDNLIAEMPSSPQRKTKRPRLSSLSGPEGLLLRNVFDPVAQHRSWCPWVSVIREECDLDGLLTVGCDTALPPSGWRVTLGLLLAKKGSVSPTGATPSQGPEDKSKRVFSIFRQ